MVYTGVLAASRMRLPGAKGASTAKGLRCQCQVLWSNRPCAYSSASRGPLVICLAREAGARVLSVKRACGLLLFYRSIIEVVSDYLYYCKRHFLNAFWKLSLLLNAADYAGYP